MCLQETIPPVLFITIYTCTKLHVLARDYLTSVIHNHLYMCKIACSCKRLSKYPLWALSQRPSFARRARQRICPQLLGLLFNIKLFVSVAFVVAATFLLFLLCIVIMMMVVIILAGFHKSTTEQVMELSFSK